MSSHLTYIYSDTRYTSPLLCIRIQKDKFPALKMPIKSKVKWFDGKKGYGFILNPEGGEDIFVHFSAIVSDQAFKVLNQDSDVEFELDQTQKGLQAKNVQELSGGSGPEQPSFPAEMRISPSGQTDRPQ